MFQKVIGKIKTRILGLGLDFSRHTLIFDKGMPTKKNFALLDSFQCSYVTSIKQCTQKDLIVSFKDQSKEIQVNGDMIQVARTKKKICEKERTVIVYISETLQHSVIEGIALSIKKRLEFLQEVSDKLRSAKRKINRKKKKQEIEKIIGKDFRKVIEWKLRCVKSKWTLKYCVNNERRAELEEKAGFKILVTDRESWSTGEIIQAYNGQAAVEEEFKNAKNPFHLAIRPQYHWTDQKIRVHFLICFISHLLTRLLYKEAKEKLGFSGQLNSLLDQLNSIRVASYITEELEKAKRKSFAIHYTLEEQTPYQKKLTEAFSITAEDNVTKGLFGFGVYK
jgi:transposase